VLLHVRAKTTSASLVTHACHALVTLGFVRRTKDLDDRRKVWLEITTEGRGFVNKLCGMNPGKEAA
jgi:DNA-binding MarR family transcriptional regulator